MGKLNQIEFSAVSTIMLSPTALADSMVAKFSTERRIDVVISAFMARYGMDVFEHPQQPGNPQWHITLRENGQHLYEAFLPEGLGVDALRVTQLACTKNFPRYLPLVSACWLTVNNNRYSYIFPLDGRGVNRVTPHPSDMNLTLLRTDVLVPSELQWVEITTCNQPYYLRDAKAGKGALLEVHDHHPFVRWFWLSFADFKRVDEAVLDRLSTVISNWRYTDLIGA